MARKRMITRTIIATEATALCLNIETGEAENHVYTVSGKFDDNEKLLKAVQAVGDTETLKVVTIVDSKQVETLYGMPEQDFMNAAEILPPRTAATDEVAE